MTHQLTPDQRDEVNVLLDRIQDDPEGVLFALIGQRDALPKVNIMCETKGEGITGSTYLNVIRVEREDDGSLTVVTDFWPDTI